MAIVTASTNTARDAMSQLFFLFITPSAGSRGLAHEGRASTRRPGQAEPADLGRPTCRRDADPAHGLRCYLDHAMPGHRVCVLSEDYSGSSARIAGDYTAVAALSD